MYMLVGNIIIQLIIRSTVYCQKSVWTLVPGTIFYLKISPQKTFTKKIWRRRKYLQKKNRKKKLTKKNFAKKIAKEKYFDQGDLGL